MAVAFRSAATATQTPNTDGINVTVTKPAGTVNGDLMVAVTHGYVADTFTPPSGWTFLTFVDDSTGLRSRAYWKIAASEGASYLWTFQPGAGGGTIGVSIASFSGSNGIDDWDVIVRSVDDPAAGIDIVPTQRAMRYDVYCWRDTTSDTIAWSIGTAETHDISVRDSGTIWRGQSGVYHSTINEAGVQLNANSANVSAAPTFGIMWAFAIADTARTAESYASTGFGVEFELDGVWTEMVTPGYVRAADGINISHGKSAEGGQSSPSTCSFTLDNTDGRFTALNPASPYYGTFGHNTPGRVWKANGTVGADFLGQAGQAFRTPQSDSVSIAGDLDIAVDAEPVTWRQEQTLAATGVSFGSSKADWAFYVDTDGYLHFAHGTSLLVADVKSTLPVPDSYRQSVRATIDVNNGASGHTVTFYTGASVSTATTQLGDAVVTSGVATLGNGIVTKGFTVGGMEPDNTLARVFLSDFSPFSGRIYAAVLKDGIAGTTVASPTFSSQTTGTYTFTDAQGNFWNALGDVICSNRSYRFHGELAALPQDWDITGTDITGVAEFAGPSRRLQQNTPPLRSAMYRYYTAENGILGQAAAGSGYEGPFYPAAYWPMEDGEGSSTFASAVPGNPSAIVSGSPTFADYTGFVASDALPNFKTGSTSRHRCINTTSGGFTVEFLLSAPSGITNGSVIANIWQGATSKLELSYPSTDNLTLRHLTKTGDAGYASVATTGALSVPIAGDLNKVIVSYDGSSARLLVQEQTALTATELGSISVTAGRVTSVRFSPGQVLNDVYIGHLAVFDGTLSPNSTTFNGVVALPSMDALNSWRSESAGDRAARLVREAAVTFVPCGGNTTNKNVNVFTDNVDGSAMGYQKPGGFYETVQQCEETDMGHLHDSRDTLGITYRLRKALHNCPARLALDYAANDLSTVPKGEYDDLNIKNIMTVTREDGGSSTYRDTVTPLQAAAPPTGAGIYEDIASVSLNTDDDTYPQAGWRVHLGTINELRYPSIGVALENLRVAASATLTKGILDMRIGDRLTVANPPSWLPPYTVTQQVVGYSEYIDKFQHTIDFHTVPEVAYHVARTTTAGTSTTQTKADSLTSVLNEDLDTTETSVEVDFGTGLPWTTSGVDFDIVINGERMTVTAVSGTTYPQTFTVIRSVNGVVKTHLDFDPIRLWKRSITAL